jgi:hypothetical protein
MADVTRHALKSRIVILLFRHLEQIPRILQLAGDCFQVDDDAFQHFLFAPQFLGTLVVIPDRGVFRQPVKLGQSRFPGIEVKDTSAVLLPDYPDRRAGG